MFMISGGNAVLTNTSRQPSRSRHVLSHAGRCSRLRGSCGISSSKPDPMFIFDGIPHVTQLLSVFRVQPGKLYIE